MTSASTSDQHRSASSSEKKKKSSVRGPANSLRAARYAQLSQGSSSKKTKKKDKENVSKSKKVTAQWERDGQFNEVNGKSSMYLLLDWLTEEGNFKRFKERTSSKRSVCEQVEAILIKKGVDWRDWMSIQKKVCISIILWNISVYIWESDFLWFNSSD